MQPLLDIAKNTAAKLLPKIGQAIASDRNNLAQSLTTIGKDTLGTLSKDVIGQLPIGKENQKALSNMSEALVQKIKGPGGVIHADKSQTPGPSAMQKVGFAPAAYKLSGWENFKNTLSGLGEKIGLKTHKITPEDYVWSKRDKEGNPLEGGKWQYDWTTARQNDKKNNRATKTEFDPTMLIGEGLKLAKNFI